MKTTKLILVAALMAFATIGFAQADLKAKNVKQPTPNQVSIRITLEAAVQNTGLKIAMYDQLTPRFLLVPQHVYTQKVKYRNSTYYIYGSYRAWKAFFSIRPTAEKER